MKQYARKSIFIVFLVWIGRWGQNIPRPIWNVLRKYPVLWNADILHFIYQCAFLQCNTTSHTFKVKKHTCICTTLIVLQAHFARARLNTF